MKQAEIILKGIVQGVGFRPFVKRTALKFGLYGFVENREFGVRIIAVGDNEPILDFYLELQNKVPPVAKIISHKIIFSDKISFSKKDFYIECSRKNGEISALIPPDIATCEVCLNEIDDPKDRHYNYPFTNCTNCGPRLSIIQSIPYDRKNTTMRDFAMCENCEREYTTIEDRRFHAQPTACPECGPELSLVKNDENGSQLIAQKDAALVEIVKLIKVGEIVAIKGLGGYHLACDAFNIKRVKELRKVKNRPYKPFALMADSISTIEKYCYISQPEREILTGQQKPIVLLKKRNPDILPEIAPEISQLGFMLPYTPLHHLIMKNFKILIMTSGNVADEALEKKNESAQQNLNKITKYFLMYNREIFNRLDDSIIKFADEQKILIRKARGFIPIPIKIENLSDSSQIFAAGADMKGSFGLFKNNLFLGSQYLGDLEFSSNMNFYEETLRYFQKIFEINPQIVIADSHPNYFSTNFAENYAETENLPLVFAYHHLAHIYSVMAEHRLTETIGVSFDGTGFGEDEQIWGGEFFLIKKCEHKRVAHLKYQPAVSGNKMSKEPWRMALIYLFDSCPKVIDDFISENKFPQKKLMLEVLKKQSTKLQTSSMGRLFDAVSSLLSICHYNSYEGEAAMKLESLVISENKKPYNWKLDFEKNPWQIDVDQTIREIVNEINNSANKNKISTKFHFTILDIIYQTCQKIRDEFGVENISFSGGVFQNGFLVQIIREKFKNSDFNIYFNEQVPPNDAGIALGQIYAYLMKKNNT